MADCTNRLKMLVVVRGTLAALLLTTTPSPASFASDMATSQDEFTELDAGMMAEGDRITHEVCTVCHGPQGAGKVGPALRENVKSIRGVVRAVTQGLNQMPAVGFKFSDREVAAVVTYVRNSWGNKYGGVTEYQVATLRASLAD